MGTLIKAISSDGYIVVNKQLIKTIGLHEAILLGELCAEYNYWEETGELCDGMFYSTRENIEKNTGLTDYMQREAMKTLQSIGILEIVKQGLPAKNYYKLVEDKLCSFLTTRDKETEQLDVKKFEVNNNKVKSNKQKNIKVLSKDNTREFSFGNKPKRENLYSKCLALIDEKTFDPKIRKLLINWLNMLLEKYRGRDLVLYPNIFKSKLTMLDKFDIKDWQEIIEYNLQRGYEGFYPIKSYSTDNTFAEHGVISEAYTKEELKELAALEAEREKNGLRTKF